MRKASDNLGKNKNYKYLGILGVDTIKQRKMKEKVRQNTSEVKQDGELCKRLKFDHTDKCYMHKPESVLENKRHKILLDFLLLD